VPLVLGVALGPHATQVEVRDADSGELVSTATVRHAEMGAQEEDPSAWWRSLTMAISRAGERQIAAISVSGSHPGLVLLDGAGVALRPTQPWQAAQAEVARLRQALGIERWARRAGTVPDASTPVTRLAWLRRTDPDTYGRLGTVLLPHDWLTYRLTGRAVTDRGGASSTGIWSPYAEAWIPDVLELLADHGDIDAWVDKLPAVLDADERADWLDAPVYEMLGLRGRPLVAPGTGAPMAVALALGLGRGQIGIDLGDRTTVLACLDEPVIDLNGVVHSRADATGRHLAVADAAGGASLVESMADLLDLHVTDFGAAALRAEPSADVVVVPGVPDRPGSVITGLGGSVGRDELALATFEGVASAALAAVDAVTETGARWYDHEPLHLCGPAESLDVQAQVLATLSGRRVLATAGARVAAGACVQAAAVLLGASPEQVALAWDLGAGEELDPADDPERDHRRAVHAEEAERQERAWDS
jgi:xylulokinase